jgi:hypothetical protein
MAAGALSEVVAQPFGGYLHSAADSTGSEHVVHGAAEFVGNEIAYNGRAIS